MVLKLENIYVYLGPGFLRGIHHHTSANRSRPTLEQFYTFFLQEKGYRNQWLFVGLKLPEFDFSLLCA